jgi:hypothetical protein
MKIPSKAQTAWHYLLLGFTNHLSCGTFPLVRSSHFRDVRPSWGTLQDEGVDDDPAKF